MDLLPLAITDIDGYFGMVSFYNIVRMPAFHFNDDDAGVRRNHNKIRMTVVDIGLVPDEIVIGKFLKKERMCVPHPGLLLLKRRSGMHAAIYLSGLRFSRSTIVVWMKKSGAPVICKAPVSAPAISLSPRQPGSLSS